MRVAQYDRGGVISIQEAPIPACPEGGLVVQSSASGLCSGELMTWYMDRKAPHVLGHEVSGTIIESQDARFPVGSLVVPHHHAPCGTCAFCRRGAFVHCETWKKTKLLPGGMGEIFGVPAPNLADTHLVDDLRPMDAALMEPLACVMKSLRRLDLQPWDRVAVIGLGVMGLLHLLAIDQPKVGYDLSPSRILWAEGLELDVRPNEQSEPATAIVVCPGVPSALEFALQIAEPDARILLYAPFPENEPYPMDLERFYMRDLSLLASYSCGPIDTAAALALLRAGKVRAEQVVSDFVELEDLPQAYDAMRKGEILKAMVTFE